MKKQILLILLSTLFTVTLFAQEKISKGTKVKILEIGKSDAYYDERVEFLGKDATALGEIIKNSEGYYSGTLETASGRTCFFTSVKLSQTSKSSAASKDGFSAGSTISAGTRFVIIEVPESDAYYSDRKDIEGQTGTAASDISVDEEGYVDGSIDLDNGKNYYFYKVKLGKSSTPAPAKSVKTTEVKKRIEPNYLSGTIKKGTSVYVADISEEDSYYSDRHTMVGKKGKVGKENMEMKEDGYYSGDFTFDDGSTAYFYKARFSKDPVDKLEKSSVDIKVENSDDSEWENAKNDVDIKEGDKVEITAVSPEDSYYEDKDDYIGKQGIAGDDLDYDSGSGGYGGSVKLDGGEKPYFYLIKLKKISKGSSSIKPSSSSTSSVSSSSMIPKGSKVMVLSLDEEDSYYSSKEKYLRKKGKVAEGLNEQKEGYYSGKIIFEDGTDAYFYMVKVKILD